MADNGVSRLGTISRYDRRFFVKSLVPECADMHLYRLMLRKEFKMLMELNHPGVVRVYELCDIPEIGFSILMEYLSGETLTAFLKQSPPRGMRRRVADSLVEALEYVHAHGVAHGDLKPDNIMVNPRDCSVKLIDFGLSDTDDFTVLKIPGGTRPYAPPESGRPGYRTSMTSDIYSLGKVLEDLRLGPAYRLAIRRACAPDPSDRPEDASEFRRLVRRYRSTLRWAVALPLIVAGVAVTVFALSYKGSHTVGKSPVNVEMTDAQKELKVTTPAAEATRPVDSIFTDKQTPVVPVVAESPATPRPSEIVVPGEEELMRRLTKVQNDVYVKGLAHLAEIEQVRIAPGINIIDKTLRMRACLLEFYQELSDAYTGFAKDVPQAMYDKYGADWNAMRDWPAFTLYSKGVDILSELADDNMLRSLPDRP